MYKLEHSRKKGAGVSSALFFFILQEHHEIDRKICYAFVVRADFTLVGEHDCTLHIVVRIRQECIQCTVYGIILTGFHLHRKNGETLKVAQKKVDFALCLVLLEKEKGVDIFLR